MEEGFTGGSVVKNLCPMQETQEKLVQSLGQEDPLKEEMATHPSILQGKFYGQRSLAGYSPWGCKESDMLLLLLLLSRFSCVRLCVTP